MSVSKILFRVELLSRAARERAAGRRVVFANGAFDLLHAGHIRYLRAARAEGDWLAVGINSDDSVRRSKGASRPIVPEAERAEVLCALEAVTRVVVYGEDTPREIIGALLPDVLVKGEDWAVDAIVGRREVEAAGGRVVRVGVVPGRSTTAIVDRIRRR